MQMRVRPWCVLTQPRNWRPGLRLPRTRGPGSMRSRREPQHSRPRSCVAVVKLNRRSPLQPSAATCLATSVGRSARNSELLHGLPRAAARSGRKRPRGPHWASDAAGQCGLWVPVGARTQNCGASFVVLPRRRRSWAPNAFARARSWRPQRGAWSKRSNAHRSAQPWTLSAWQRSMSWLTPLCSCLRPWRRCSRLPAQSRESH
mmetsp:Transcript_78819/g.222869  ORF Transcript_78819/g.222869 Transcript_78819/m.222869 type:complete len:203 (+) Transcript_78819:1602-2210(+)